MPKDGIDFQLGFGLKLELNNLAATIAPVEGGGANCKKNSAWGRFRGLGLSIGF